MEEQENRTTPSNSLSTPSYSTIANHRSYHIKQWSSPEEHDRDKAGGGDEYKMAICFGRKRLSPGLPEHLPAEPAVLITLGAITELVWKERKGKNSHGNGSEVRMGRGGKLALFFNQVASGLQRRLDIPQKSKQLMCHRAGECHSYRHWQQSYRSQCSCSAPKKHRKQPSNCAQIYFLIRRTSYHYRVITICQVFC